MSRSLLILGERLPGRGLERALQDADEEPRLAPPPQWGHLSGATLDHVRRRRILASHLRDSDYFVSTLLETRTTAPWILRLISGASDW